MPDAVLSSITPLALRRYLVANGWKEQAGVPVRTLALFRRINASEPGQLTVPLNPQFDDYARGVRELVERLSEFEGRPIPEIVTAITTVNVDTIRYRVSSPDTRQGEIPLNQAVDLLDGVRKSLLSCAHSVLTPQPHHPRLARAPATQLLDSCRMAQTERASFAVVVSCPLDSVDVYSESPDGKPFARQTTTLLIELAQWLVSAIESDRIGDLYQQSSLSTNFCDALLQMQPAHEQDVLDLSVDWATSYPPPRLQGDLSRASARFRYEYFPIIRTISQRLRGTSAEERPRQYVGTVEMLNGNLGDDSRVAGEVEVSLLIDDEWTRARLDLDADDYQRALDAHGAGRYIKLTGVLQRGRRVHHIMNIVNFAIID